MINLEQLQILAQLIGNMELIANKIEKAYNDKDNEEFIKNKKEILNFQRKISEIIK